MLFTTHFYGNEISDYGKQHGYVDYRTLAKAFQGVLCNNIITRGEWEIENGSDAHYNEIFQYFIIDENGAEILKRHTNEIVFYNYDLDLYVWGVTHWGTSWDYVLTDIPCEKSAK